MKIRLFVAALSAMTLGACSQYENDTEVLAQSKKVGFSIDALTRADIRNVESICEDGFKVSVIWDNGEPYSNVSVNWNGTGFESDPVIFWPFTSESEPCVFNAVSYPGIPANPISYKDGENFFEYSVAEQAENQQDVLVASVKATEIPEDGVQRMVFGHALTKVNFTLYVDDSDVNEDYVWRVSSISLKAKDKGVYTFGAETPWSVSDSYADMEYLPAGQTFDLSKGMSWEGKNNFMLIPQTDEKLTVTVTWAVYYYTGKMLIKVSDKDLTKSYKISTSDWHPGASRRYSNLRLPSIGESSGSDDGQTGDYDIDVEPWEEETIK